MLLREIWTAGIDWNLPGNGGPECASYLSPQRQVLEFVAGMTCALISILIGSSLHSRPISSLLVPAPPSSSSFNHRNALHNNAKVILGLLISLTITYLVEISYKLYTFQAIFIVNPCHCLCLVQIFILWQLHQAITRKKEFGLPLIYTFRVHLFFLHGPLMAVIFPVTNTLFLPGEVATYWIEHAFLLGIPIYLLKSTDLSVPSKSWVDFFGWGLLAYGIWGLFHFLFLQPLATISMANLNSMLCPAITDPFRGPDYRSYGIIHQFFITLVCGCVVNSLGKYDKSNEKLMLD